jgi:DNA-binding NarL/FixJ family response regulator
MRCHHPSVQRRVLIVDDHAEFRLAARALLVREGFDVVGEAEDAATAIAAARLLAPDVVLLDVRLPDGDGFGVAAVLGRMPDPPAIVLVSTRPASAYRRRLASSPARGFLAKADVTGDALREILAS